MIPVLHAHSGLRYLVLLAGVVAVLYCVFGLVTKRPAGKPVRILGALFVGLMDLQILLGVTLILLGVWYPRLMGHVVMMVLGAALAHAMLAVNRRRPQPGYVLPLIGVAGALLFIFAGIMAIGRGVLTMTVGGA